jgi:hypothetical protein
MRATTTSLRGTLALALVLATVLTALISSSASAAYDFPDPFSPTSGDQNVSAAIGRPDMPNKAFGSEAVTAVVECHNEDPASCYRHPTYPSERVETLEFDVSEDMGRFAFDPSLAYEDGMPKHGSAFVTQGYLYPVGTLDGTNGVLADGSPEFPDLVIGRWYCYGHMIGDAGHATSGVWVISTQVYDFGPAYGDVSIVTTGFELADFDQPITRAISGGTGAYKSARGEAEQVLLGFNATVGVVLRVKLDARIPSGGYVMPTAEGGGAGVFNF